MQSRKFQPHALGTGERMRLNISEAITLILLVHPILGILVQYQRHGMADNPDMMDTLMHVNCPDTSQASCVSSNVWIKQVNPPCAKSATPAAITDNHLSFIDTTSTTISSFPFNATLPVAPVANFSHGRCEGIDLCGPCALSQQAHPDP